MDLQKYYENEYQDRGMKKWTGFILAEHAVQQEQLHKHQLKKNHAKEQMTLEQINNLLNQAVIENHAITIQLEAVDQNGAYFDDVVGVIMGHDELGIFIGNQKVAYDEIRHIALTTVKKWSDIY